MTHGFLIGLCNLKQEYEGKIIACWDSGHTRRRKIDPEYKRERREKQKTDDEIQLYSDHLSILKWFLKLTGILQVYSQGEEADDLMYTLAKKSEGKALIVSNDHDMHQVLGEGIYQLLSKRDGETLLSARRLERDQGVTPRQYSQAMALAGCSGDGVPGVKGVGIKTAIEFVTRYPDLVPAILGENTTPLDEWAPKVDSRNRVTKETKFFPKRSKGPSKKLRDIVENPWIVYRTRQLTQLYELDNITFVNNTYDEDRLLLNLERVEMHECASRIEQLGRLHK
jgi:5'-3' exonuclease